MMWSTGVMIIENLEQNVLQIFLDILLLENK